MTAAADPATARAISIADLEALAAERMRPEAWDYLVGGAEDERTAADNVAAWSRHRFLPRVLTGGSDADLRTTLLGQAVAIPIGVAPVAAQALTHPDAEVGFARAAAAAGAVMCVSTVSSRSLEEVAAAVPAGSPRWFQLYVNEDRRFTRRLVERAEGAGYGAVVLTADLPVLGYREREKRRDWELDAPLGNFTGPYASEAAGEARAGEDGEVDLDQLLDTRHVGMGWEILETLRSWTGLPIVVKGILHPGDAHLALEHGAAAVWVSNHGGRQLDRSVAAVDALPAIVDAVGGQAEVYVDGGLRRGSDALVALALGARAVFAGRAFAFGLGAGGEAGVERAFAILREELERAMVLLGAATPAAVDRGLLAR